MATRTRTAQQWTLPRGGHQTLVIPGANRGEVELTIPFRMASLVSSGSGRLSAHTYCGHRDANGGLDCTERMQAHTPSHSTTFCQHHGYDVETVSLFDPAELKPPMEAGLVEVDKSELGIDGDKSIRLVAWLEEDDVEVVYYERPYVCFWEEGQESNFDLIASAFRVTGKVAIGTFVSRDATKAIVLRWSEGLGCLIAQQCHYDAKLDLAKTDQVVGAAAERETVEDEYAIAAAETYLAGRLAGSFDFGSVVDEFAIELESAVRTLADGKPLPAKAETAAAPPVGDLMAALSASVTKASGKAEKPAAKKPRAKVGA